MNLNVCDVSDEFEPRQVPRPAPRFDSPPVPSVPEVSLVFDNPQETRNYEIKTEGSPTMNKYESYAAWKAKKFSTVTEIRSSRSSYDAYNGETPGKIERSNSQNESSSRQNNIINDESLKHSKSDPSLTNRIESLGYLQNGEKDRVLKVIQEREKHTNQRYVPNVSRNQERDRRYHTPSRSPTLRENSQRIENVQETSPHNNGRLHVKYSNTNIGAQYPQFDPKNSNFHPRYPVSDPRSPSFPPTYSAPNSADLQNRNLTPRNSTGPSFQNFSQNVCPRYPYPPYFEPDYPYPFPYPCHPSSLSQKSESDETVKNLLQLVNNQSEQIKSLQSQVERLLKIQEESLKDRAKCKCLQESSNQNSQRNMKLCLQATTNDQINVPNIFQDDSRPPPRHNNTIERNMIQNSSKIQEITKNITTDYNSQSCDNRMNLPLLDEQMKNKILEQKVSIGVMTSFEFTVQNNPFNPEVDEQQRFNDQNLAENGDSYGTSNRNMSEDNLTTSKNQSPFSRVSNMPLENIIEDSESHISSSRQPSSNFHPSPTTDELPEMKQASRRQVFDSGKRLENIHRSQSPRMFDNTLAARDSADNAIQRQKYLENQSQRCLGNLRLESSGGNSNCRPVVHNSNSPIHNMQREEFYNWSEPAKNGRFENVQSLPVKRPNIAQNGQQSPKQFAQPKIKESVRCIDERNDRALSESNSRDHYIEDSIILSTGGLEIKDRAPPSPEPSIHVDMQEYSSDEDSDKQGSGNKQTPKIGWTFYNNVLGQVNQILQSSPMTLSGKDRNSEGDDAIATKRNIQNEDCENKATMDAVKIATMEQLKKLGISFLENTDSKETMDNKKVTFDSSFYPRLEYRGNMAQASSVISETDTSMKMNALALKYLSDEQLGDLALQKQGAGTLKHLMVSNVQGTNMSFATMRYLERYQLMPGKNGSQLDELGKENLEVPRIQELKNPAQTRSPRSHRGPPPPTQTTRMSYPSKILDISTLKQQPKLL